MRLVGETALPLRRDWMSQEPDWPCRPGPAPPGSSCLTCLVPEGTSSLHIYPSPQVGMLPSWRHGHVVSSASTAMETKATPREWKRESCALTGRVQSHLPPCARSARSCQKHPSLVLLVCSFLSPPSETPVKDGQGPSCPIGLPCFRRRLCGSLSL